MRRIGEIAAAIAGMCALVAAAAPWAPAWGSSGEELALRAAAAGRGGVTQAPLPEPPLGAGPQQLSNETTLSRWAYVERPGYLRAGPSPETAALQRLRLLTQDRTRELVLALEWLTADDGTVWVRVRFSGRPNNRTGWIPRRHLGDLMTVHTRLTILRKKFRATLFVKGRRVWSAPIAVGRGKWPTPAGSFYVRERLIPARKDTVYGVFAFGISATSPTLTDWPGGGVVGIHGTNRPELIPGRVSHGCIRVRNRDISELRRMMPLGTPVHIR